MWLIINALSRFDKFRASLKVNHNRCTLYQSFNRDIALTIFAA
ncbi:hypothetical protein PP590_gp29 [Pseudoalteromonas phage HS1]|nr:hypothetical protein PP589_gp41 [Pseudoalteromonas phage HS5]YP_010660186.1 hypothetical protein PP590_gp29 [Pseudoalteromonas phage HS1]